jgi:hypothetical protein
MQAKGSAHTWQKANVLSNMTGPCNTTATLPSPVGVTLTLADEPFTGYLVHLTGF